MLGGGKVINGRTSTGVFMSNPARQPRQARYLVIAGVVLGLPAVIAALSHSLFRLLDRHNLKLPELLEDGLYWMMVSTGTLSFLTVGALIVAIVGSFLPGVAARAKIMMWIVVVLSMAAFVYLTLFFIP
jgi:hypothetical protein